MTFLLKNQIMFSLLSYISFKLIALFVRREIRAIYSKGTRLKYNDKIKNSRVDK